MKFKEFVTYLEKIQEISSRNEMIVILAEMLNKLEREEISEAVYFIQGRVAPLFIAQEFNFSTKLVLRSLSVLLQTPLDKIDHEYKLAGDVGLLIEKVHKGEGKQLELSEVFHILASISLISGKNSQTLKQTTFLDLAKKLNPLELKYVCRILVGSLRLGLSSKTILDGIAWALTGDKSLREQIEKAYGVNVDLGLIATIALKDGVEKLEKIKATPGVPIASKLVEREREASAIIERLGKAYIQPKFDGLRTQIHYQKSGFAKQSGVTANMFSGLENEGNVRIFSRNLENMTNMFPDIVAAIRKLPVESVILDCEALAYDKKTGKFLPFQETTKRRRKNDIVEMAKDLPLQVNVFDILELNGEDLLHKPLSERIGILNNLLGKLKSDTIKLAENTLTDNTATIEQKFNAYVGEGLEGIIAKGIATKYDPGTRNFDWIKLKFGMKEDLADTVDAVILGYYYGTGVRSKFGIGAILIGVYDDKNDRYISLAKVGTGFKDEDFVKIKQELDAIKIAKVPSNVIINKNLIPDVIVNPEIVCVVEADSISLSNVHGANKDDSGAIVQGLSLRFPRIKQFGRDKKPEQATTVKELKRMYELAKN